MDLSKRRMAADAKRLRAQAVKRRVPTRERPDITETAAAPAGKIPSNVNTVIHAKTNIHAVIVWTIPKHVQMPHITILVHRVYGEQKSPAKRRPTVRRVAQVANARSAVIRAIA